MWAILELFATSSPKIIIPKIHANWAIFSKGMGERGKREGEGQIAQIAFESKQLKSYFIKKLFSYAKL
jgi:hypothetical protein